jgi:hypothetical protein
MDVLDLPFREHHMHLIFNGRVLGPADWWTRLRHIGITHGSMVTLVLTADNP